MTHQQNLISKIITRLRQDGNQISHVTLPSGQVTVGYQSQFRWRWMATKLHLFTVVMQTSAVDAQTYQELVQAAVTYGDDSKGKFRGFQSGVAVIPVLIADTVTPEAIALATSRPPKMFAIIACPILIDSANNKSYSYDGKIIWGLIYSAWLQQRLTVVTQALQS